jgi:cyanophycinase
MRILPLIFAAVLLALALDSSGAAQNKYQYFRTGNPADVQTKTAGGFALMGGGDDLDAAFRWMCELSGGGDFLVLRARGDDAYNPYIKDLCHVNSVATLVIPSREAAADPFVSTTIRNAEAIFIAGGDQARYINWWMGTPVQDAINDAIARSLPVGGTSAGLAVQGEFVYSAQGDAPNDKDLSSKETLANPFSQRVTIAHQFLKNDLLKEVITDTHFAARDRMGRSLVFMARILQDGRAKQIRDIAVDERTAVLLDHEGVGRVVGDGNVYFMQAAKRPEICRDGVPLTFRGVEVRSLRAGEIFNVRDWSSTNGTIYTLSVEGGVIHSTLANRAIYTKAKE